MDSLSLCTSIIGLTLLVTIETGESARRVAEYTGSGGGVPGKQKFSTLALKPSEELRLTGSEKR
jgi:hypothetical protein